MNKRWGDNAWEQYLYWYAQDKKTFEKINKLIKDIERNGVSNGLGKPEKLTYDYAGYWSRRIDVKNRLVYNIDDNGYLYIAECKGHYK